MSQAWEASEQIRAPLAVLVGVAVVVFILRRHGKTKRDERVVEFIDPEEVRRKRVAKVRGPPVAPQLSKRHLALVALSGSTSS